MAKSLNRYRRRQNVREPKRKFVIATEGEKTEKIYFDVWKQKVQRTLVLKIIEAKEGDSSPGKVLKRLEKFLKGKSEYDAKNGDEFWLVIDRDRWEEKEILDVYEECRKKRFNLALSNPCFELWLNFHQENPKSPKTCSGCLKEVKNLLKGKYDKNDYDAAKLIVDVACAIETSRRLHEDKTEPFPADTGTHVYLLVEKIAAE